jgi:hypothetical protein
MWEERAKGVLIIIFSALVALGIVRYLATHQEELVKSVSDLTPAKVEKNILGVISRLGKKDQEPVQIIEEKASQLIEEIKKLPQEQAKVVKKRVLKEVCEEVMEEK